MSLFQTVWIWGLWSCLFPLTLQTVGACETLWLHPVYNPYKDSMALKSTPIQICSSFLSNHTYCLSRIWPHRPGLLNVCWVRHMGESILTDRNTLAGWITKEPNPSEQRGWARDRRVCLDRSLLMTLIHRAVLYQWERIRRRYSLVCTHTHTSCEISTSTMKLIYHTYWS
jgi:hypothetical protein